MDTRKVAPETTDIITHVSDGNKSRTRVAPRPRDEMIQKNMQQGMPQNMQPGMQPMMQPGMQPMMQPGMHQGMQQNMQMQGQPREMRQQRLREDDDLVFGAIPKMTLGLIALGLMFILALVFGIKELDISIPVFIIVLVFCTVMGVLLSRSPGFVSVIVAALLLVVGGLTSLFPAVAIGGTMLVSGALILKGE
ncbi:MAG: hypothetical protein K6E90_03295 [Lachnospiraceae bacterium]|nr:hypothetical protein [Lachnospiraceae bacterium]